MATVKDAIAYLLARHPGTPELPNARLTKLVYLADWRHSIETGRQVTPIAWVFNHYGPYVDDVRATAATHRQLFSVRQGVTAYGNLKWEISLADRDYQPILAESERAALNHVIETTARLSFDGFIQLVYSTFPVVRSERYDRLDLPRLAEEYKPVRKSLLAAG